MNEQLKEGFLNWPKSLEKACERAEIFKSLKQKISLEKKDDSFSELKNHCEKIKDLFDKINEDIVERPYDFICYDQPYIVYNAFKYNLYNNKILKTLVVNNDNNIHSDKVIHHFPGGPGKNCACCRFGKERGYRGSRTAGSGYGLSPHRRGPA
jgi:hypothetical protein